MTFTPPAHTPYQWQNSPSQGTPLNAAHLEAAEDDLVQYTQDAVNAYDTWLEAQFAAPSGLATLDPSGDLIMSQVPVSVALGTQAGASAQAATGPGRPTTGRTSTLAAPVLRDVYSLDDQAGATADGAQATLTMASGNATPTACSVTMTAADIGKAINVPLNGGGLLATTILSVSGGVPTLSAAPGAAATATVGWYGTDNTTSVANLLAVGAALAVRSGTQAMVVIPSGAQYMVQSMVPPSNVTVWGYGATLLKHGASTGAVFTNVSARTALLQNFRVYGLTFIGEYWTNATTSRTSAINIYDSTGCTVKDCTITGFYEMGITFSCGSALRIKDNVISSCAVGGAVNNAIMVTYQATVAWSPICTDIEISGNTVTGCTGGGICIQCASDNTTGISPYIPFNARIHHNNVTTSLFSAIALETGRIGGIGTTSQGSTIRNVQIDHNQLVQTATAGSNAYGITATDNNSGATYSNDPLEFAYLTIDHNEITSSDGGMLLECSYSTVDHNTVFATVNGITFAGNSNNTPTTCEVTSNLIRLLANSNGNGISNSLPHMTIAGNHIAYDPGSTSGTGDGILLNYGAYASVVDNDIDNAPRNGIRTAHATDARILMNRISNPSASLNAGSGITVVTMTTATAAGRNFIDGNIITDDRATSLMQYGLNVSGAGNTNLIITNNKAFGYTQTAWLGGSTGVVLTSGNISAAGIDATIVATQQASTYTFVLADAGTVVESTSASGVAWTIPPNSSVAYPIGAILEVFQSGAGQVTLAPGAGVTLLSDGAKVHTAAQYATIGLRQRAVNFWVLSGDLA